MQATYFDGRSAAAQAALVRTQGTRLLIENELGEVLQTHPLATVKVEERLHKGPRVLKLPNHAALELRGPNADDWLANIGLVKPKGEWLHSKALGLVGAAFAVLLALAVLLKLWIPEISRHVAQALPSEWAEVAGQTTLEHLDEHWFAPSQLSKAEQQRLQGLFNSLKSANHQRLVLRKSKIGPNAVALADGTVVLTDELVKWLRDDQAIVGVLLHELGHIDHQHGMRALVQNSVGLAVASLMFGDVSILVAAAANQLTQFHYSRDFEREADLYAIAEFKKRNLPLKKLLVLHEKMMTDQSEGEAGQQQTTGYWDSHPSSQERIEMIRAHLPK